jgi:DNA-binding MarR family transcriptional regulator
LRASQEGIRLSNRQLFFTDDGQFKPRLKPLSKNQRSVLSLLNAGLLQAGVALRLNVSRPYVNQIARGLESLGLVKRRGKTYFYDLSPEAKSLLSGALALDEFTPARLHNFRKKFRILTSAPSPSLDSRAHYTGSWKMRGPLRHKFWYSGGAGTPSVTVDYHIKTLVIYVDKGQQILARSVEEAAGLGWLAVQKARDAWIREQHGFGIDYSVEEIGTVIAKVHAGFVMMEKDPVIKEVVGNGGSVGYADYWIDKSPEKELGSGHCEAETAQPENMTRLGRGIQVIETIQPEAFKDLEKIGAMNDSVVRVEAMLQGGITISAQYEQMVNFMTKALDEMAAIRAENAELKKRLFPQ